SDQLFRLVLDLSGGRDAFWKKRYSSFLKDIQKRNLLEHLIANRLPPLEFALPRPAATSYNGTVGVSGAATASSAPRGDAPPAAKSALS
ncbi:hypothetical protein, partial [Streptococcus pneumoniae]|uniref:hypothetical protein n=1 Tax=Streptococcus pneumoniae TaxID=1313 RepID=UPI001E286B29